MTIRFWCLAALASASTTIPSPRAARAGDVKCSVKVEACGALEQNLSPLLKIKEGICVAADIATIGAKPKGIYYSAVVWVGVGVSGDTLVFGKGEVKTGITMTCAWELGKPKPEDQIASLKSSIPQLLKDEKILKAFPGVKKIDVSRLKSVTPASASCCDVLLRLSGHK